MTRLFTAVCICLTIIAGSTLGAKIALKWTKEQPLMADSK